MVSIFALIYKRKYALNKSDLSFLHRVMRINIYEQLPKNFVHPNGIDAELLNATKNGYTLGGLKSKSQGGCIEQELGYYKWVR